MPLNSIRPLIFLNKATGVKQKIFIDKGFYNSKEKTNLGNWATMYHLML